MSSEMFGGGAIAAIVLAPPILAAGAALGAGWVAWQAGKLAISAAGAVNEEARRKQFLQQESEKQKKAAALAAHRQMVDMCRGVLAQLDATQTGDLAELEALRRELRKICQEPVPEDTARVESLNARGLLTLERVMDRQSKLGQLTLNASADYEGYALSDLMEDLRLAVSTVQVAETRGTNVTAADPRALERADLHRRLADVSARIMEALDFIVELDQNYGISNANSAWFQSCFAGVDEKITGLCSPRIPNEELKRGIRSLEDTMKMYDMFCPTLRREQATLDQLYPIYLEAAKALCEKAHSLRHFRGAEALLAEMERLKKRATRAAECAALYQALGEEGYLCYAWDQELTAMGYNVCSRKKITKMVTQKPAHARIDGEKIPFYEWTAETLTQIYEITPECRLQLIVHPDGTTTMETISAPADPAAIADIQKAHCQRMQQVRQRLRENWFILQDLEETSSPETIHSLHAWQDPARNPWVHTTEEDIDTSEETFTHTTAPHQKEMHME